MTWYTHMKKGTVTLLSLFALLFGTMISLTAQTGANGALPVVPGDELEYESITTVNVVRSAGNENGQQMAYGMEVLRVDSIQGDRMYWTVSTISNTEQSGRVDEPKENSGVIPVVMSMITDREGRVITLSSSMESLGMGEGSLFSFGSGKSGQAMKGPGWFYSGELRNRKPGDRWEEKVLDTVEMKIATVDLGMIISVTMKYSYEGLVDTMGVQAARIQWGYDDMTMSAEFEIPDTEMTFSLKGKGSASGFSYYTQHDNILLKQHSETEMTMDIDLDKMGRQEAAVVMTVEQTRVE